MAQNPDIRAVRDLKSGLTSLAHHLPKQAISTLKEPAVQYAIADPLLTKAGLRSSLGMDPLTQPYYTPYYFGNPQLFRMPEKFQPLGAFEQDTLKKALPFIAVGIAGIVLWNIVKGK